jgi:hypothetical protein
MLPGMKQLHGSPLQPGREIRSLEKIAAVTRQTEVGQLVASSVLTSHDVLDVKRDIAQMFGQAAILATLLGALPNLAARWRINHVAARSGLCP